MKDYMKDFLIFVLLVFIIFGSLIFINIERSEKLKQICESKQFDGYVLKEGTNLYYCYKLVNGDIQKHYLKAIHKNFLGLDDEWEW